MLVGKYVRDAHSIQRKNIALKDGNDEEMKKVILICDYCMTEMTKIEKAKEELPVATWVNNKRFDFCSQEHYEKFINEFHPELKYLLWDMSSI